MTYRSLLVLLDPAPLCVARSQVAIRLARELDCHLVGLAPTGLVALPPAPEAVGTMVEYGALAQRALRDQAERAAQRFRDACAAAGVASFEALTDESDKAVSLVRHAHCSDLLVLTQADPNAPGYALNRTLVEEVVLQSARPTLIVPYAGRFETLGSTVMVAWDDSREAARAVADALPLLRRAGRVHVLGWNEQGAADALLRLRLEAVQTWLKHHGIAAHVHLEGTEIDIADAMLSRAADLGADLIVMGAYGHVRWIQRMLGGATSGLLASMTVPVLMSR